MIKKFKSLLDYLPPKMDREQSHKEAHRLLEDFKRHYKGAGKITINMLDYNETYAMLDGDIIMSIRNYGNLGWIVSTNFEQHLPKDI